MTTIPTIGFISAPAWFDPAPSEFPTVVEETVATQQAPLLLPDFDYRLDSIAAVQDPLNLCARSLQAIGCDMVGQVGSPFAWAGASSESDARARNTAMAEFGNVPSVMTGLAIVDGLRSLGATRVAVNCTYYESQWRDCFASFLRGCGFEIAHVSTLVDQGLAAADSTMEDLGWSMTHDLTSKSIVTVAQAAPDADAIVVTGAGTRTLEILSALESEIKRPIVAADTILYWAIARAMNLTLKSSMGSLKSLS